jgi:hypothetical protein
MRKKVIGIVLAVLSLSLAGCGTVCNFAGGIAHPDQEPKIYGGFQRDINIIDNAVTNPNSDYPRATGKGAVVILAIALVDPVVSFVADTLTLPITIPIQYWREKNEKNDEKSTSNTGEPKSPFITLGPPVPVNGE